MNDDAADIALLEAARLLPRAAREAIRSRLEGRGAAEVVRPEGPLAVPAPVFVTLRIGGELRGCIGSLMPLCGDLVEETMDRACAAAFEDPRFPPLTLEEIDATSIEVSILRPLRPVASGKELDPARFGIEVTDRDGRRAVLLPGIDGIDTVERQIEVTRRKAGISADADVEIRRFSVVKVPDPDS